MNPQHSLEMGAKWPYELTPGENLVAPDWAHATARGILADLQDRRGIKQEFKAVDYDVRKELVATMAEIIREGAKLAGK